MTNRARGLKPTFSDAPLAKGRQTWLSCPMSGLPPPEPLTCFKAYDIRGRVGHDLTPEIAYRIGRAFAEHYSANRIVLGRDIRESSGPLASAVAEGITAMGAEVLDLGLCGTEEVYFGTAHHNADGGICVTASHNPIDYNGMKLVQRGAAPIAPDTDLAAIKRRAEHAEFGPDQPHGPRTDASGTRAAYVDCVMGFIDTKALKPLHILVNAGNGAAGPTFDAIADRLAEHGAPLTITRVNHDPDGSFPNGIPNPILPENHPATANALRAAGADLGIAWDGDFDRCFFFDHTGAFIPGEYIVGLLAEVYMLKSPGASIVHDPRIIWNTQDVAARAGGTAIMARTGHVHLKQALRDTGAVYGGEMSAHHYFRDFMCCDSGMIPWLLLIDLVSRKGTGLHDLVTGARAGFPSSGEINFRVVDVPTAIAAIAARYAPGAQARDDTDGLSLDFGQWRFNLRASNTEPLLRLNVETRADAALLAEKTAEITALIETL